MANSSTYVSWLAAPNNSYVVVPAIYRAHRLECMHGRLMDIYIYHGWRARGESKWNYGYG